MSRSIQFPAIIQVRGINPYVLVSARRARALRPGWRKPLPVLVRLNGQPAGASHINLMPVGNGSYYLYLNGAIRRASGTAVGDRVRVEIEFDAAYRNGPRHAMPAWFRDALAANPLARQNWIALVPSRKKEILRYFSFLKSPEARARNLVRALHVLSGEPARFMGRAWNNGS